jgi:hypothetical protein
MNLSEKMTNFSAQGANRTFRAGREKAIKAQFNHS